VECPRCGEYEITDVAKDAQPDEFVKEHLYLLSALARNHWDLKKRGHEKRLRIDAKLLTDRSEFEARVLSQCPRGVQEKMNTILRHIAERSKCPGHAVRVVPDEECARVYCKNGLEMGFFLKSLRGQRLVELDDKGGYFDTTVTADGWTRVEELDRPNAESKQAFVAMWFDGQLDAAYTQGITEIEQDTGFKPLRIDMKQFNEKICDHIVAEIRRSRFLIADVTGHRQGVYFEAGFAMGLGLPVIWTCRKDQIDECHFDTRQYNHIVWTTPEDLREKLKDRILATIGRAG